MNQEQELIRVFGSALASNSSALRECASMLRIYNLAPENLYTKWESYLFKFNLEDESSMTEAHVEDFKNYLRGSVDQPSQAQQLSTSTSFATPKSATIKQRYQGSSGSASRTNHDLDIMDIDHQDSFKSGSVASSPLKSRSTDGAYSGMESSPSSLYSPSSKAFASRTNMATKEETLNSHLSLRSQAPIKSSEYKNAVNLVVGVKPYRYMFEKITEKAEALDDKIDAFAALYKKVYPETDFRNPAYPSQGIVTVIGRVCSDANEGKSNEKSLVLETSRTLGGGSRIKLDVTEISGFGFFPGQIVVLSGINANGTSFAVTKLHELPTLPMAGASPQELLSFHHGKLGGQPIKMIAAAGPFTLNDNLLFEPFAALMETVNKERPDILLLMGPFISSQHPSIVSGDVDMSPEAYFAKYVSQKLAQYQDAHPKDTQILLVPSQQDVIHETIVLPQPGFEHPRSLNLPVGTYCLPNPAQFTVNEMVFAVSTTDILLHLSGEEVARNHARTDRMGRLCKYLVEQRSMHPVYPGVASITDSAVDFNQYDLLDLKVCPDVIIVPSKLKHFAKTIDNVIMVNPNQLSKGQAGGTYALLTIHPLPRNELEDAEMMMDEDDEQSMSTYHRVYERCRVDLVRV